MTNEWIDRVRSRMDFLGISQETLARALDCSRGAVGHYLAGRRTPSLEQLEAIAEALDLNPSWLLFGDYRGGIGEPAATYGGEAGIPVRGTTDTGPGSRLLGRLDVTAGCRDAYALLVTRSDWAPRIHEGETILLCPERGAEPGDEVCVRYRNGGMALQLLIGVKGDQVILDSLAGDRRRERQSLASIRNMHPILAVFRGGLPELR